LLELRARHRLASSPTPLVFGSRDPFGAKALAESSAMLEIQLNMLRHLVASQT
jgi:hypothetical protein